MKLSPERATFDSPGQRPGSSRRQVQALKGRNRPYGYKFSNCKTVIPPLQGLPRDCRPDPARCTGLLNFALSGLGLEDFLMSNSRLKNGGGRLIAHEKRARANQSSPLFEAEYSARTLYFCLCFLMRILM